MKCLQFLRESIFIVCLISLTAGLITAQAASALERKKAGSDNNACPVVLLKNQDYYRTLANEIAEAKSEIIMAFFLFKSGVNKKSYPDIIIDHLIAAAKRGVDVVVILENTGGREHDIDKNHRRIKELLGKKGVKVYFDSPRRTMHAKLVVIDKNIVLSGSHNLTQAALKYNNEISILIKNRDIAGEARSYMLAMIKEAK